MFRHHRGFCGQGQFGHQHGGEEMGRGRGRWPGGDFGGHGGPFGGFGPFGRKFGGRAKRGDVRTGILALLAEAPRNGYQIMQELESRSRGMWRPSPGSVYPALQLLEDEGLVRAEAGEGSSRIFVLTDKGKEAHDKMKGEAAPWDAVGGDDQEPFFELMAQMRTIGAAVWQVAQAGNAAHLAEARKILVDARKALYKLLAEDGPES